MSAPFIDFATNDPLDSWSTAWNQPSPNQIRTRAVEFLHDWRQADDDWFSVRSKEFLVHSQQLGYRKFDWEDGLAGQLQRLHFSNHTIWHFEDEARRDDIPPESIVELKRGIDAVNQIRNNRMEKLDEWFLDQTDVVDDPTIPFHTEPPGLIFDRLSIMSLKYFHYSALDKTDAVKTLDRQRTDLSKALQQLFADLKEGKRRIKVYRQLKLYNDPETNPALS